MEKGRSSCDCMEMKKGGRIEERSGGELAFDSLRWRMPAGRHMLMRVVRRLARQGTGQQFERGMHAAAPDMQGVDGALSRWFLSDLDSQQVDYVVELWTSEPQAADCGLAAVSNRLLENYLPEELDCHACEIRSTWVAPDGMVAGCEDDSCRSESRHLPVFVRLTEGQVHPGMWADFQNAYELHVETHTAPGLQMRWLARSRTDTGRFFTVSMWDSLCHMESFERSDAVHRQILKHISRYLCGISSAHHCEVHRGFPLGVAALATMIRASRNV
ncbi:antibiotic biosynthesis monooxygenase family protein [Herbaspirillum seropedicae]|uniref:antibiotic biosynthesis monooxygenase family protein n=1 Tax=Herbaspirillum seropedicae TaxID=964 RepID=UPI0008638B00|nr:antibiotic biosynthesis monooxygenase [Herbaspirillum seropedicae]AON53722.1 hypothetical protein Hsc_1419 [Herbaspirillum seropedicae]